MTLEASLIGAMTLFVEDLDATKRFYHEVFSRDPIFEEGNSAVFRFGDTLINLLRVSQAPELIEPAKVAGPEAGSRFQLTIWVDDCDATVSELKAKGVTFLNGPQDRFWGQRTAAFADPSGHVWEIAQALPPS
jgi:catechol 2,3-dioxygenase-like lactoylglutathione lyase family enzyme